MTRPLRRVAVACLLLFGLLLANANYRQVVKADEYRNDDRNARVLVRAYESERGSIALSGPGRRLVARSVETDGRLRWLRRYPEGPTYAHVTGYLSLVYGRAGVEELEDPVLSGEDPRLLVRSLSDQITGREQRGGDVVLTVVRQAQEAAVAGLRGKRGAVVALDPRTGAVLALASAPTYDPNRLSSFDPADVRDYYERVNDPDARRPMLNRALSETYPPGSTFKVITAAAALAGGTDPDTRIPSPTQLVLPQTTRPLRNFGGETCGNGRTSTLTDAMRISCNTAFAQLGLDVGADALREQARAFGFDDEGLRLAGTADRLAERGERIATSAFPDDPNPPQLGQSAIGQFEVRATPLQMALVAAGVANRGRVMQPHVVREVTGPDLARLDTADPRVYRQAVSADAAADLTRMMEEVVADGTATSAQIPGVRVAGKTGTAQHAPGAAPHAWFIGFAPADDPQVAVAVLVENGGSAGSEATGGRVAAPIARDVMQAVLGR